jgi:hypothetical protein
MIKLLMSWDIKSGQENDYFEFIVREFAPGMIRLGLRPVEAWYTVYGNGPQILTSAVTDDLDTMLSIINSAEWQKLKEELDEYVSNFRQAVVQASNRFQIF